jgi:hypothetical protein
MPQPIYLLSVNSPMVVLVVRRLNSGIRQRCSEPSGSGVLRRLCCNDGPHHVAREATSVISPARHLRVLSRQQNEALEIVERAMLAPVSPLSI